MRLFFLLMLLISLSINTFGQIPPAPSPARYINDYANVITEEKEEELERYLLAFHKATTSQVVVVTVESLGNSTVEDYGNKKTNNGVLILAAIEDRKLKIEVGYGAESLLTDSESSNIIKQQLAPNFKRKAYEQGIEAALDKVLRELNMYYFSKDLKSFHDSPNYLGIILTILLLIISIPILFKEFGKKIMTTKEMHKGYQVAIVVVAVGSIALLQVTGFLLAIVICIPIWFLGTPIRKRHLIEHMFVRFPFYILFFWGLISAGTIETNSPDTWLKITLTWTILYLIYLSGHLAYNIITLRKRINKIQLKLPVHYIFYALLTPALALVVHYLSQHHTDKEFLTTISSLETYLASPDYWSTIFCLYTFPLIYIIGEAVLEHFQENLLEETSQFGILGYLSRRLNLAPEDPEILWGKLKRYYQEDKVDEQYEKYKASYLRNGLRFGKQRELYSSLSDFLENPKKASIPEKATTPILEQYDHFEKITNGWQKAHKSALDKKFQEELAYFKTVNP